MINLLRDDERDERTRIIIHRPVVISNNPHYCLNALIIERPDGTVVMRLSPSPASRPFEIEVVAPPETVVRALVNDHREVVS